jgi:hypothetical protein
VKVPNFLERTIHQAAERLKKVPAAPRAVAGGVALGMFWSFTPFVGLKTLLAISTAWLMRSSKIAAFVGISIHDLLTPVWPLFLRWEYDIGFWLLRGYFPKRLHLESLRFKTWLHWDTLKMLWPTFLGSLVFAVPAALLSYWIVYGSLHRYHRKHPKISEPPDPAPGPVTGA